ncbi:MAG: hypothetical protein HUK11_10620, partial [Muribaculaceae bacterium]|nr:hypothetical protein [Muribaculaceae bacterium]
MKARAILLLCFGTFILFARAQDAITPLSEDVVEPRPATSRFAMFETPRPQLSTGTVCYALDLFTVKTDGVEIPISLCYSTQGIKVNDDPYPCGYGWALLPSLRISRTVMGRPDERYKRLPESRLPLVGDDNDSLYRCVRHDSGYVPDSSCHDTQHDIFNVSLPGIRFGFVVERRDGRFVAHNAVRNGCVVEADSSLSAFTVRDTRGNTWYLGGASTETSFEASHTTAWAVSKVVTATGDSIVFEWEKRHHAALQEFVPAEYRDYEYCPTGLKRESNPEETASLAAIGRNSGNLHLAKVIFPKGEVGVRYAEPMMANPDSCGSYAYTVTYTGGGELNGYALSPQLAGGLSAMEALSVNYYDSYIFCDSFADTGLSHVEVDGYDAPVSQDNAHSAKGMATGALYRVLGSNSVLASSRYYDARGNVVESHEQNLMGGYEHYYYHLTFTGKPLQVRHDHVTRDTIITEVLRYTYDNMERLVDTYLTCGGGAEQLLTRYTYAADGRKLRVEYLLTNARFADDLVAVPADDLPMPMSLGGGAVAPLDSAALTSIDSAFAEPAEVTLMTLDYCGNHIYRNGRLERMLTDVGYIDTIGCHYYVKDYRGDIRTVVGEDGTL